MTKTIVHSLLTLAVSSSIVLAQGGGWSGAPGKGLTYDGGDAFSLKIANQFQTHWTYTANDGATTDTSNFTVRRARTALTGHMYSKDINYVLRLDAVDAGAAGDGNIKDGYVQWTFMRAENGSIGLRMGQAKTQFGLEATGSSSGLFFVERSSATRGFADARSRGAWLMGVHADNMLRWSFGAMNGATASGLGGGYVDRGEEAANSDNELSYVAAANFDPMGDYYEGGERQSFKQGDFRSEDQALKGTVGVGLALENGVSAVTGSGGADIESTAVNVNTAWSVANFQAQAELFLRTDDQQRGAAARDKEESMGWYLQGGYVLPKSGDSDMQWGFGLRVGMVESDVGNNGAVNFVTGLQGLSGFTGGDADVTEISLVGNAFYHGHAAKSQFEYTFQDVDAGTAGDAQNHILRIAFQLLF